MTTAGMLTLSVSWGLALLATSSAVAGSFSSDFNAGLPAGSTIYIDAHIDATGGVGNSGVLKLTDAVDFQGGAFYLPALDPGLPVTSFSATFQMLIGGGTLVGVPADGVSFNFAADLPAVPDIYTPGEEGAGTGLIVSFDTFDNGAPLAQAPEAPAIDVIFGGALIGRVFTQSSQGALGNSFFDVFINLDPDGTLDVSYNGSPIFANLPTGYAPITNGIFALAARTGAGNDNQWIDNLNIQTSTDVFEPAEVPEPSTFVLAALGLAGLGLVAWKRRRIAN